MAYFKICPFCGAHLDSCERCDCLDVARCGLVKTRGAPAFGFAIRSKEVKRSA